MASRTGIVLNSAVRVTYDLTPTTELGVRVGYGYGFTEGNERSRLALTTVVGTSRFFLSEPGAGLYLSGSIGFSQSSWRVERGSSMGATTRNGVWCDAGAGWILSRELPLAIEVQVQAIDLERARGSMIGIGLSAGYQVQF